MPTAAKPIALKPDTSGCPRWFAIGVAAVFWLLMALVSQTATWQLLELKGLDQMMVRSAPNKSAFPITIVAIDEASFENLGMQWPWPRSLHAELVDQLVKTGAALIVFDVVFSEPSTPKDDARFADAIFGAGNVILAADRVYRESTSTRQWRRLDPYKEFLGAGAQVGLATVALDADLAVRQIPTSTDALWRSVVIRLMREHPEIAPNLAVGDGAMIRYVGGDHVFPYVSYHEVIKPSGAFPADFFKDQVVIVGRDVKASPDVESAQSDLFVTPFTASTGWLTPGAEIHANILETMLGGKAVTPLPLGFRLVLLGLVAAITAALLQRWRPLLSLLIGVTLAVSLLALAWSTLSTWNLFIPIGSALSIIPLTYITLGGWSYVAEQLRRREITRAFSLYVTPQVVDYMIDHPERIRLGGERRELTLMFTDLKGFTTISESLSAERVANLLNRYFSVMTDIVLDHRGTVCSFIGDAIMAFWGAPLDDHDQAYRAVTSAMLMQQAMQGLREEFASEGLPALEMRIGVHSGSAIVGNLGSAKRFDYTAIGDDVNLAARLEGINKLYGTEILLSLDTATQVRERIPIRMVDRVIVKGKSTPIDIFTPCTNKELADKCELAISSYQRKDWDAAESAFREVLEQFPDDTITPIYLARIADFRVNAPQDKWDGSVQLDKL